MAALREMVESQIGAYDCISLLIPGSHIPEGAASKIVSDFVRNHYQEDPDLTDLTKGEISLGLVTFDSEEYEYFDPEDRLGGTLRRELDTYRVVGSRMSWSDEDGRSFHGYCAIVFPNSNHTPRHVRLDVRMPVNDSEWLKSRLDQNIHHEFSGSADLRSILACKGFERKFTICIGAPSQASGVDESSRNSGFLPGVWNDYNAIIGLLGRFHPYGKLPGVTAVGIVQDKGTLIDMMDELPAWSPDSGAAAPSVAGFDGTMIHEGALYAPGVYMDRVWVGEGSAIPHGKRIQLKDVIVSPGGDLSAGGERAPLWKEEELLIPDGVEFDNADAIGPIPYGLIYYAGHGSPSGNLQINAEELISPNELLAHSKRIGIPLLVIADMCHSHQFGSRFRDAMAKHDFPGVVIAATSNTGRETAMEAEVLDRIPRPPYATGGRNLVKEFAIQWMKLESLEDLPVEGKAAMLLATVSGELQVRIFDPYGQCIVDIGEHQMPKVPLLGQLKELVEEASLPFDNSPDLPPELQGKGYEQFIKQVRRTDQAEFQEQIIESVLGFLGMEINRRGVFSTAFCWSFLELRAIELAGGGGYIPLTIDGFVKGFVENGCDYLGMLLENDSNSGSPRQIPDVFSL